MQENRRNNEEMLPEAEATSKYLSAGEKPWKKSIGGEANISPSIMSKLKW